MKWLVYGAVAWFLYKKLSTPRSATPAPSEPVASVDVTGGSSYTGFRLG